MDVENQTKKAKKQDDSSTSHHFDHKEHEKGIEVKHPPKTESRSTGADLIKIKSKDQRSINGNHHGLTRTEERVTKSEEWGGFKAGSDGRQHEKQPGGGSVFKALEAAQGRRLLICIKGYPDPDNIGSALALKWLADQFDIQSTIIHFDEISHHENKALVKKLDIEMTEYYDGFDLTRFDYFAVNDSQSPNLPIMLPEGTKLLVFVDHHKALGTVDGFFVDIREESGSTSAIYAQYLRSAPVKFTGSTSEEAKVATALMHGIRSDTDNFVNATAVDYEASGFLAKAVDKELLHLISRQNVPAKTMDLTQVALQRKDIRGQFMFSGVGFVREEDRDGIGQCADYLLHREGIDTVIVYGVVGNEFVDGSLRTRSHTLDPDKWIKDVFGADKDGKYYGGGRKDKGGFQIPLGVFSKCKDKELLWILIKKTIDELFYEKIGIEASSNIDSDMSST